MNPNELADALTYDFAKLLTQKGSRRGETEQDIEEHEQRAKAVYDQLVKAVPDPDQRAREIYEYLTDAGW